MKKLTALFLALAFAGVILLPVASAVNMHSHRSGVRFDGFPPYPPPPPPPPTQV
jgi:hypothetical protein